MSRVSSVIVFGGLVLTAFATPTVAHLENFPPRSPIAVDQSEKQEVLQIFNGTIVSMSSGIFFLKNDVTQALYGLDDQDLAREFANKKVSVTGTLGKMHTIHVRSIEEQKA
jgi:hypothetical protein